MCNFVYIATSLDGFIARKDGSIDWLTEIENPEKNDYGFNEFLSKIDAVVMGRKTYEFVKGFDANPYGKPVFVLSNSLKPEDITISGVKVLSGSPPMVVKMLNEQGYKNIYIDGGKTIQGFLSYNLIDELITTRIPILLGSGIPLFGYLENFIHFKHIKTDVYSNGLVKSQYKR